MLSLGIGVLAAPGAVAGGSAGHGPADSAWPAPPPKKPTENEKALDAARAQAKSTGKPVAIGYLTTQNAQTVANPDGTLSTDTSSSPLRVRSAEGTWQDIDATLRARADGTVTPTTVPSPLVFSGGGDGPMATMTTSDGKKLAIKAPFRLPKPVLDGDSALYEAVMPDVDLELTATPLGGWRQVLIVHTARAAADPAVKRLHLDVVADGLTVSADAAGNLKAADALGRARFSAPSPVMWDSSTPPTPSGTQKSFARHAALTASADGTGADSTADGPGAGAIVAKVAATADDHGIDLVPDTGVLEKGTGPWFIDPGWNPSTDNTLQAWAQVQEAYPSTNEYKGTQYGQDTPATGYCGYVDTEHPCSPTGRTRAYFQVGIGSAIYGATVLDARLYATVIASSSPSTRTPLGLYETGTISDPTSWNHQPCGTGSVMGGCSKIGASLSVSGTGSVAYDVTSTMRRASANRWGNFSFGFAPDDENNKYYRQRFTSKGGQAPHVVVTYDINPAIGNPRTSPAPGLASTGSYTQCNLPEEPGWIGATSTALTANTDSRTNEQLYTTFKLWDNDNGNQTSTFTTGWNSAGDVTVNSGSLVDGHQYGWQAITTDGTLSSDPTGSCYFRVDRTPPTATVASSDFPPSGTPNAQPLKAGQEGTFTLTGTDPAPVDGGRSSGLACARWTTDPVQAAATGWRCTDSAKGIVRLTGGKADIKITPPHWGTNFVYLQTQDNAGNMSQPAVYSYYAPSDLNGPRPVFGDVTGDSIPDVLLPDSAGDLRQIGGGTDPNTAPNARIQAAPGNNGWTGIQITHRGSLASKNVDDLLAHQPGAAMLYDYLNDTNGGRFDGQAPVPLDKPTSCVDATSSALTCADYGYGGNWSKVTQIAAFGSPSGDSGAVQGTGQYALPRTSLLFVENGRLWLALRDSSNHLGRAMLLSANDQRWDNYELITPGRTNGNDFPTLWARSKTTGAVRAFTVKGSADAPDLTGFIDPAQGVDLKAAIDPERYPRVGSDGDLTGDGIPDLWAVDTNQQLVSFSGAGNAPTNTAPYPTVTSLVSTVVPLGNLNMPMAGWKLTGPNAQGKVDSSTGNYPATATNILWPTATVDGRNTDYAFFSDTQSAITTSTAVVDTRKSFTISTWAKASDANGVIVSQDNSQASDFMLFPEHDGAYWRFAIGNTQDTTSGWRYDSTSSINANALLHPDVWTKLTAVYDARTGRMGLYADGVLVGSGHHNPSASPAPKPDGPFALGRYQADGKPNAVGGLHGGISNLAIYPYAASVTAPGATGPITAATDSGTCVDDDHAASTDGNQIEIYTCNQSDAQQFELRDDATVRIQGKCVEAANSGTTNNTLVQLMTCTGAPNQQWQARADGSYLNPVSNRCLDRPGGTFTPGTQLQLYECNGAPSQRWATATLGTAALPSPAPLPANGKQPTPSQPAQVASGDFNGDGKSDVATLYDYGRTDTGNRSALWVSLSDGKALLPPQGQWDSGDDSWNWNASKLTSGDFNGDGKTDIAILYNYGQDSTGNNHTGLWFAGGATGLSTPKKIWDSSSSWNWNASTVASGDFNGDGKSDIAVLYDYGRDADGSNHTGMWVLSGEADGVSAPKKVWDSTDSWNWNASTLVAGDFNGDGKTDAEVLYDYGQTSDGHSKNGLWTFTGIGDGLSAPRLEWTSSSF
ncbi:ricin-type beta-trefoil lectin domain protein [Streptomyces sp. NPDC006711]|uniref:ricin-type beta-trefoil lectin domain protein n=1 Tax=Streptomyces sp. NPDC006711 TaxID=3364762 RepID=UPI0036A9A465